jgi:hypothetical protein
MDWSCFDLESPIKNLTNFTQNQLGISTSKDQSFKLPTVIEPGQTAQKDGLT